MENRKTAFDIIREAEEKLKQIGESEKQFRIKEKEALEKLKVCDKLEEILEDKRLAKIKLIKFKKMIMRELAAAREARLATQTTKKPIAKPPIPVVPVVQPQTIATLVAVTTAAIDPIAQDIAQLDQLLKEYNEADTELRNQINDHYKEELNSIENGLIQAGATPEQARQEAVLRYLNLTREADQSKENFLNKHDQLYQELMSQCEALTYEFIDKASPPEIEMPEQLKQSIDTLKAAIVDHCATNTLEPMWETDNFVFTKDGVQIDPSEIKVGDAIDITCYVDGYDDPVTIHMDAVKEISTAGDIVVVNDDRCCFTNLNISHEMANRNHDIADKRLEMDELVNQLNDIERK